MESSDWFDISLKWLRNEKDKIVEKEKLKIVSFIISWIPAQFTALAKTNFHKFTFPLRYRQMGH